MVRLPELWREPLALSRRMERLFDDFFSHDWPFDTAALGRTDIYEKDGQLVYETELPGVKREDVHIKVEDGRLILSGETKREERIEQENYLRMGRQIGKFQRSFPLPEEIGDPKRIKAKFEDGILRVSVPLKESLKERERPIEIRVE
jgi:HSP20 family protein